MLLKLSSWLSVLVKDLQHLMTMKLINVFVGNDQIERVNSSKSLGLKIYENLTWKRHIDEISKKVSAAISALKRIRSYISQDPAARVYQGLIEPYFSYCAPVWDGIGSKLSDKLQKLQNRAARVITRSSYDASSSSVLDELIDGIIYILTVKCKKQFSLMYKITNNLTPMYLQDLFVTRVIVTIVSEILKANCFSLNLERIILSAPLVIVELHYGIACLDL